MENNKNLELADRQTISTALKVMHDMYFTPGVYEHSIYGKAALWLEKETVEIVHGIWVIHPNGLMLNPTYECSACHEWVNKTSKFCPNCGANMDGGFVYGK